MKAMFILPLIGLFAVTSRAELSGPRWYVGAGLGEGEVEVVGHDRSEEVRGLLEDAGESVIEAAGAEHDNTHTWQVFAGYRFKSWLAAEAGYINLGKTDGEFSAILAGPESVSGEIDSSYQALAGSALFSWPAVRWVAPFVRLGGHYWQHQMALSGEGIRAKDTDSGFNLLYGVGVDFFIGSFIGFRVDWLRYQGIENEPGIDVRELGLLFRF